MARPFRAKFKPTQVEMVQLFFIGSHGFPDKYPSNTNKSKALYHACVLSYLAVEAHTFQKRG
jgi:hypothetical protein